MDYIEEKTPSGITIKVILKSWEYTAFDKSGSVIYTNETGGNVLHKVPVIAFFGKYLDPVLKSDTELIFYKIRNGEIVIPYEDIPYKKRKYLFLKNDDILDLIPIRVLKISNIYNLVHDIESGIAFNYIVLDKSVSKNEIVVIKNRCPSVIIIQTGIDNETLENEEEKDKGVSDITSVDKNLNIMSNNPVFLAKIHLKRLALSNVNQILLDFDISSLEAEYMLRYIETMLNAKEPDDEIEKARPKLEAQADAFRFYINLLNKNDNEIRRLITEINDIHKVSSYSTLLAKVKLLFSKQEELLMLTEYENLLFEMKDKLHS
ncbi:MAG: hypothetical protein V1874_05950 [Spirochaetota bacterium]